MASDQKTEPSCTVEELVNILTAPSGGLMMLPSDSMNEVYPGIFIGDGDSAKNVYQLRAKSITHVLNTAKSPDGAEHCVYHVNIDPSFYEKKKIKYLAVEATDIMNFCLYKLFDQTSAFIEDSLKSGGIILVHCREGASRSATVVLAYLMMKQHMTAQDAVRLVRKSREITPNDGFLQQLCDLNEELTKKG